MEDSIKERVCAFDNLYNAMRRCSRNVRWKDSVSGYRHNCLKNILHLRTLLLTDKYEIQPYTSFTIYEPKKREIISSRFVDRIFQRSFVDNYLYEEVTKHFIYDNCACQIGKGPELAKK